MRIILNVIHGNTKSTQLLNDVKLIRYDSAYTAKLVIDGNEFEVEHPSTIFGYKMHTHYKPNKHEENDYRSDTYTCYDKYDDFESFINALIENEDIDTKPIDIILDKNNKTIKFICFDPILVTHDNIEQYAIFIYQSRESDPISVDTDTEEFDKFLEHTKKRLSKKK